MDLSKLNAGDKAPDTINVVIEITQNGDPVKYEVDKDTGALVVDRFMSTAMFYPCNYGYVPATLADDGDPVDVLVITPNPVQPGSLITCRPVGMLSMTDEAGTDHKVLAVPIDKISCGLYKDVQSTSDVSPLLLKQISHFFEHYKDLEPNKWVKVEGWKESDSAKEEIQAGIDRYEG